MRDRPRVLALDVLRGFALCGILPANLGPIAEEAGFGTAGFGTDRGGTWLPLLVEQRFFPIFSVLFGIGFTLLLESAGRRVRRPRVVLLRRLLVLLALGLAHLSLLWQGDVLSLYAVVGLCVLLPSTWLPRWSVAVLAGVLLVAPLALGGGGAPLVPGLLLLGAALTRYGVLDGFERSVRVPAVLGAVCAAAAAPALRLQLEAPPGDERWSAFAGLLMAGGYVSVLLLLLRTPLRPALAAIFAPLGRMSLTHYLSATVLVLAAAPFLADPSGAPRPGMILITLVAVLLLQWTASVLWLRRHRRGPVEWVWHLLTWARLPAPLRRETVAPSPTVRGADG
ncbi:putative membrane protein YeiB [Actinocorallia herbida]|uniref:Putative membrane protein YeiB n=1 Tax=Actinocorallia herbida TaxID=58109 RepID=A0A3N1CUN9_9ACTN|nr:DUF418 domain-containing protein [Actinocorallia herbida]ROO85020.1 putative membrane protein YeiB [Actinocorallia herbida]